MPKFDSQFMPKMRISGTPRKRGSYYNFDLLFGGHLKLKSLRYYFEEGRLWFPERKVRARKFLPMVLASARFNDQLLSLCKEKWPA